VVRGDIRESRKAAPDPGEQGRVSRRVRWPDPVCDALAGIPVRERGACCASVSGWLVVVHELVPLVMASRPRVMVALIWAGVASGWCQNRSSL
jgi:hypothetical protein